MLLQQNQPDQPPSKDITEAVELAASIEGDGLSIVFRRNIEGIIQRLGEIILKRDVEQEIELFDWVQTAVKRSNNLETRVAQLQHRFTEQQDQVQKLNKQLDDFIKAKEDHETDLLEKFQRLLNEKKLKIRDQQRLLNSANTGSALRESLHTISPQAYANILQLQQPSPPHQEEVPHLLLTPEQASEKQQHRLSNLRMKATTISRRCINQIMLHNQDSRRRMLLIVGPPQAVMKAILDHPYQVDLWRLGILIRKLIKGHGLRRQRLHHKTPNHHQSVIYLSPSHRAQHRNRRQ